MKTQRRKYLVLLGLVMCTLSGCFENCQGGTTLPGSGDAGGGGGVCGEKTCQAGEECLSCGSEFSCQPKGTVCCAPGTGAGGVGPVICQPGLACIHCGPNVDGCMEPGSVCCKEGTGAGGSGPLICSPKETCQFQECVPK
ncbi:hypothetical protein LZ198_12090 [Myxococcus sp. K15C18031901]|uniref:hypothetical protein n=1 Tax=Myxococcus dinghuensis TaxID=2906761 RepID=UPI0020A765E3|nr:hypothetical protein [Myxococcus dinghuensis]MCP3099608.1 hypothetical protein [Myxococcus dinghuensis]